MEAQLKIISGPFTGHVIPMPKGKFLVGREPDCQCVLDDLSISRHHCVLLLDDWSLRVRDLGSKNGTVVNKLRIDQSEKILTDGDIISVGTWVARVDISPPLSPKRATEQSLDTNYFESDTTQLQNGVSRPAELNDERQ
jgi:pSer/pThr/pTyr-binding forkhead associated (FHA) protein